MESHRKEKGHIDVSFSKNENTLVCEITDDGVGIDTAKVGKRKRVGDETFRKKIGFAKFTTSG